MANKSKAKGAGLKYAATSTPTTAVVQIVGLGLDDGERTLLDATTHDSTTTKDYLDSGLRDTFGLPMRILVDPADEVHELMRSHHNAGTPGYATIVLPDAGNAQWTGPVQILTYQIGEMTPDGLLECTIRMKYTSAETFTA